MCWRLSIHVLVSGMSLRPQPLAVVGGFVDLALVHTSASRQNVIPRVASPPGVILKVVSRMDVILMVVIRRALIPTDVIRKILDLKGVVPRDGFQGDGALLVEEDVHIVNRMKKHRSVKYHYARLRYAMSVYWRRLTQGSV